ncbi:hypothetical protein [Campylobacter concisus]
MLKKILLLAIGALFACCATSAEIKALSAEPNFGRYDSKQVATKDRQNLINTPK